MFDTTPSPYWPHARGTLSRGLFVLIAGVMLVLIASFGCFYVVTSDTQWRTELIAVVLVVAFMVAVGIVAWCNGYNYRVSERRSESWQWSVPIRQDEYTWSKRALDLIRFTLKRDPSSEALSDRELLLVTRRHWAYLVYETAWPILTMIGGISALVYFADDDLNLHRHPYGEPAHVVHLAGLLRTIFLVACIVGVVWTAYGTMKWLRHFIVVTNATVKVITVYPVWLPWLRSNTRPIDAGDIRNVYKVDSHFGVGGLLGYGNVDLSTYLQEDEDIYFKMKWVPKHTRVRDLIDDMRMRQKRQAGLR